MLKHSIQVTSIAPVVIDRYAILLNGQNNNTIISLSVLYDLVAIFEQVQHTLSNFYVNNEITASGTMKILADSLSFLHRLI